MIGKLFFYGLWVPIMFCVMVSLVFVDFMMAMANAVWIVLLNLFTMPNWICDCAQEILNALVDGDE